MKKQFIVLFAFMFLVEFISTHSITKISNVKCDPSGKETFDLEVTPEGDISQLTEFKVTLKNDEGELTASCTLEESGSDMPKDSDSDNNIEGSEGTKSDEESELPDAGDKTSDSSNKIDESDKDEIEPSDEDENSVLLSQSSDVRRLQEKTTPITYVCSLDSLTKPGSYKLETAEGLSITFQDNVEFPPCSSSSSDMLSSDERSDFEEKSEEPIDDLKRADIKLSFRQVLEFNKDELKFNFIGLTTEAIPTNTEITFMIFIILGTGEMPTPVEAKCSNEEAAEITTESPIAIAAFECSFELKEEEKTDLESIKIASSDFVAGLPADEALLNPVLTDEKIKEDPKFNKTQLKPPKLAEIDEKNIKFDSLDGGKFELEMQLEGIPDFMKPGSTFEIPLVYPEGVVLLFTIVEIKEKTVSLSVEIQGEVNDQSLVLEQTIISIDGMEAFLFPGFSTEKITTEGVKKDSKEISSDEGYDIEGNSEELIEDLKRANITLSFRQVLNFDLKALTFDFVGITTEPIDANAEITFMVYLILGTGKQEKPTEITCTSKEKASPGSENPTAVVLYTCTFPQTEGLQSLEIASSDFVAGFPANETLLNPALTDAAIDEIGNLSKIEPPQLAELVKDSIELELEKGKFEMQVELGEILDCIKQGNTFEMHLVYPEEIRLVFTIVEVKDKIVTLSVEIHGEVNEQSLVIEQVDVIFDNKEAFILPGFTIPKITTEGVKKDSDKVINDDSDIQGKSEDNELSSEEGSSDNTPREGKSYEEKGGSNELSSDESTDEEGKSSENVDLSNEENTQKTNETSSEEVVASQQSSSGTDETSSEEIVASQQSSTGTNETSSEEVVPTQQSSTGTNETSSGSDSTSSDSTGSDKGNPVEPTPEEMKEDALVKAEIFITFRQISGFAFVPGTISFNFFALITQTLPMSQSITLLVNLITIDGMVEEPTEIECKPESSVEVKEGETKQAPFKCEKKGLIESLVYTSLRLNSSDSIAGIPIDDETALNPALTDEAIENGEVKDFSDPKEAEVPPSFTFESIKEEQCTKDGKFLIKGSLSEEKTIPAQFSIPLTYPEGITLTCSFEEKDIQCIADKELDDSIIIEQMIITEGSEELFILKKIIQDSMKCENGLKVQAEEKTNIAVSFRQVCNIEPISSGFSFFFAAFVNTNLPQSYELDINVIIMIEGSPVKKVAKCTLKEAVTVTGAPVQGDFECKVDLEPEEKEKAKPEDLSLSPNNDKIGGCSELTPEELNPSATKIAIEEGLILDFSVAENKKKVPPSFTISKMNFKKCGKKGKIKVEGEFSEAIEEEMTFELPFSFPATRVKCTVDSATAKKKVEIVCKMQKVKKFLKFKQLIIEPRLLKKRRMEMFYVEKANIPLDEECECQNYNDIKLQLAKKRKKEAKFSFIQVGRPMGFGYLFFLALTKKKPTVTFTTITIEVTLTVEKTRRRNLDTLELDDEINIECKPTTGQCTDNSCPFNCEGGDGSTPVAVEIEDDLISGAPGTIEIDTNPTPDYSTKSALEDFDNLPSLNVTNIKTKNCSNTGKYKIEGTFDGALEKATDITIPFDTPDSSGLCELEIVDSSNFILNCENKEQFDVSEMMLSPQAVYDKTGKKTLFKISNDFTAPKPFACAISDKTLPNETDISTPTSFPSERSDTTPVPPSSNGQRIFTKNSNSGLSGGAIAGIVVACVAVIAIVGAVFAISKRSSAAKAAENAVSVDNITSIN